MARSALRPQSTLAGIALVTVACACFAVLDTTTKSVSASVPLLMALWFRYAFQAGATTLAVLPLRGVAVLRTRHLPFHCLRGLLLVASSLFAFASLRHLPVGEFTAIVMISPLAITVLAATVLKEHVAPLRWLLVAGGFAGTLVIIRPGGDAFQWASLLPLGLVASNAWFQVLTSKLARTEDPVTTHLYTGWVGTLVASAALPFVWTQLGASWLWLALGLMGAAATVGHFVLILAYQRAPAATLTPFLYTQIAFAMVGGWLVFGHLPDGWSLLGIGAIAVCGAGGAWLTVRERRVLPDAAAA
jgi:drug/metabolite transporter (DMT)-like permease